MQKAARAGRASRLPRTVLLQLRGAGETPALLADSLLPSPPLRAMVPTMTKGTVVSLALAGAVSLPACRRENAKPDMQTTVTEKAAPAAPAHTNRLAREKSPYLLQHQHNPVDWYAWGEEAFAKARQENKPIFLSIGYSTCHWCHVMERESFESEELAKYLNAHFVSIKVDREERPDVDKI